MDVSCPRKAGMQSRQCLNPAANLPRFERSLEVRRKAGHGTEVGDMDYGAAQKTGSPSLGDANYGDQRGLPFGMALETRFGELSDG
jgi:hypothetical protein